MPAAEIRLDDNKRGKPRSNGCGDSSYTSQRATNVVQKNPVEASYQLLVKESGAELVLHISGERLELTDTTYWFVKNSTERGNFFYK